VGKQSPAWVAVKGFSTSEVAGLPLLSLKQRRRRQEQTIYLQTTSKQREHLIRPRPAVGYRSGTFGSSLSCRHRATSPNFIFLIAIVAYREVFPSARPIETNTHMILGILCALLAGLAGFFMTGDIAVQIGSFGQKDTNRLGVQAAGGAALFVLVLWWWRSYPPLSAASADSSAAALSVLAEMLRNIDKHYPEIKAVIEKKDEEVPQAYRVISKYEDGSLFFLRRQPDGEYVREHQQITRDDFDKLPRDDKEYILSVEESMRDHFRRWTRLYRQRARKPQVETELTRLAQAICQDLERILVRLGGMRIVLDDHYNAMRDICIEFENRRRSVQAG